ncbi:chemotaxis protein MotC [Agrobacterium vitis]|nr:chemotaxis protein MotC [Agrobacterium vitis]MBE1438267.1 chemotaxis protein MotC [Agrobacterium vitis]
MSFSTRSRLSRLLVCGVVLLLDVASVRAAGGADDSENLPPYLMLRSLQFVQDSVVMGDHSAADMQRFVLERIDKRLRSADPAEFRDPRNVDAALIYTMSGGNPATLEYLVSRDIDGHFDNRVTDVLRQYLSGKGALVANSITSMVDVYKNTRISAYLALVAGNVTFAKDPAGSLKFYDLARLFMPGTIVEEAALRRSFSIAIEVGQVQKALIYANRYARRFLHSPYANQFADMLVQLIVDHFKEMKEEDVLATLAIMDPERQREIYLRIARRASINGNQQLAALAAGHAQALVGSSGGNDPQALLYGGLARIPTTDVKTALKTIENLKESELSASDKALLEAARRVAEDIVTLPTAANFAVPAPATTPAEPAAAADTQQDPTAPQMRQAPEMKNETPMSQTGQPVVEESQAADPVFDAFVTNGRSKLDEIDKLLNGEGGK